MSLFRKIKEKMAGFSRRTWTVITALAVILAGGGGYAYYKFVYSAAASSTTTDAPLQTSTVRQGNLVIYASGNGTLVAAQEASFSFGTSGQVTQVNARVGDLVKAGDVLAEMDDTTQQIAYTQAKRALAELTSPLAIASAEMDIATALEDKASAKSQLEYLISPAVLYWEGEVDTAGKALAEAQDAAKSAPSAEAAAKVTKAEETLKYYQDKLAGVWYYYNTVYVPKTFTNYNRMTRVRTVLEPTEAEIQNARATLAQAEATVIEAQTYLSAIKGESVPENATGSKLTALEDARLALISAEENLAGTKLVAPISGTLMTFDFTVGDKTDSSTTATVADLDQPNVQVYLDPSDWTTVKVGKSANVVFDSLPDTTFSGKVTEVDPGLYTSSGTSVIRAMVQLELAQASFDLPLGSTASVDVIGGEAKNALLIPVEALHAAGDQYTVFVLVNGVPTLRIVQIGIQDQVSVEIKSGLQPGDVVTTGITGTKSQ